MREGERGGHPSIIHTHLSGEPAADFPDFRCSEAASRPAVRDRRANVPAAAASHSRTGIGCVVGNGPPHHRVSPGGSSGGSAQRESPDLARCAADSLSGTRVPNSHGWMRERCSARARRSTNRRPIDRRMEEEASAGCTENGDDCDNWGEVKNESQECRITEQNRTEELRRVRTLEDRRSRDRLLCCIA